MGLLGHIVFMQVRVLGLLSFVPSVILLFILKPEFSSVGVGHACDVPTTVIFHFYQEELGSWNNSSAQQSKPEALSVSLNSNTLQTEFEK